MSQELETLIKSHIHLNGPMSVETYWNFCLAHPQFGYYITRDPLGQAGDFTTAPEISQLFGEMIGIWAAEQWNRLGQPHHIHLVEIGPGRGTLMSDLLRIARLIPDFLKSLSIHLIETSPALRNRQKEKLAGYDVSWHDTIETIPQNAPVILIGNEFLDALPIQQFAFKDGQWFERMIGIGERNKLVFGLSATPVPLNLPQAKEQDVVEISAVREAFTHKLCERIKSQGGAALLIDYGHDVSAMGDTLQAVRSHAYCDLLKDCGEADITSHVDFGRLKSIAEKLGCRTSLQGQGSFLKTTGIELRAEQILKSATEKQKDDIRAGLNRLVDDKQMGTLFRVMEIAG